MQILVHMLLTFSVFHTRSQATALLNLSAVYPFLHFFLSVSCEDPIQKAYSTILNLMACFSPSINFLKFFFKLVDDKTSMVWHSRQYLEVLELLRVHLQDSLQYLLIPIYL